MYHVSAQGVDERMINVHYYYYYRQITCLRRFKGSHSNPGRLNDFKTSYVP